MSAAHLHAVPNPDDVPAPAPAPAAAETPPGEGAAVVGLLDAATVPTWPTEEAGDEPGDQAAEEEPEQGHTPRRAFAFPCLHPYVVVNRGTAMELGRELGSLAADVTRTTAPRVRRGLAPVTRAVWRVVRAGTGVVFLVLRAWFVGEIAPKVPPLWRLLLGPLLTVYAVGQAVVLYPWAPLLLPLAWPLLAVVAQRWADGRVKQAAKAKASGKGGKGTAKEDGKAAPKTFAARLAAALHQPAAEASPEASAAVSAGPAPASSAEVGEEAEETPVQEAPAAPSREDIVRALHALVGGSSGVLHTALRDHLRYPSTRAAREALDAAHIPSRPGVRAEGGNGPGVHRMNIPPLPPSQEGAPGSGVVAGQHANNNANNIGEGSREGLAVDNNDHERPYPFDVVRDPDGGPSAWRIIPRS
ncbi:hypothetical protein [Streptomyces alfalfae]